MITLKVVSVKFALVTGTFIFLLVLFVQVDLLTHPFYFSDRDSDCEGALRCGQRSSSANGLDSVIGCDFQGSDRYSSEDFCFSVQSVAEGVINYIGECGTESYLCSRCEGDCDVSNYQILIHTVKIRCLFSSLSYFACISKE